MTAFTVTYTDRTGQPHEVQAVSAEVLEVMTLALSADGVTDLRIQPAE
jgi:hypothetical protein